MSDHGSQHKTIIGWSEYVSLPEWGITQLHAKVDTGARTSALHVEDIEPVGDGRVRFHVVMSRKHAHKRLAVTAPVLKWGRVRSSTGHYSLRCFVRTRIRIGDVEKEIDISLVSREKMLHRMLVGRTALEHQFLVDVGKRRTIGKRRRAGKKAR